MGFFDDDDDDDQRFPGFDLVRVLAVGGIAAQLFMGFLVYSSVAPRDTRNVALTLWEYCGAVATFLSLVWIASARGDQRRVAAAAAGVNALMAVAAWLSPHMNYAG